jgi:hypothetical protein
MEETLSIEDLTCQGLSAESSEKLLQAFLRDFWTFPEISYFGLTKGIPSHNLIDDSIQTEVLK